MAMDIQTQAMSTALPARQPVSIAKTTDVDKPAVKSTTQVNAVNQQPLVATEPSVNATALPKESLQEAVNKLQDYVDNYNRDLSFSIDDDTGRTVVRLMDSDKNVVRQYPSEEVLNLLEHLEQNKGLFIDQA